MSNLCRDAIGIATRQRSHFQILKLQNMKVQLHLRCSVLQAAVSVEDHFTEKPTMCIQKNEYNLVTRICKSFASLF